MIARRVIQAALAPAPGRRIGLLGGSFNPAHEGHLHISDLALKRLALDEVWWLVSPQNPLKPTDGMAPFTQRLASARELAAGDARLRPTDIESRLGTRYTVDTLERLVTSFPDVRFVWLMGADNLAQIPRWRHWTRIFELVPVAVFGRAPYSLTALSGKAACRYRRQRWRQRDAASLAAAAPPAWVFVLAPLHPASGTALRARRRPRGR